jgi:outer membrane protein OmpA-like peptidoglycan-associated protein
VKFRSSKYTSRLLAHAACAILLTGVTLASTAVRQIASGQKAKVKGQIMSRSGDLVKVKDVKDGSLVLIDLTDDTKIERDKGKSHFFRHTDMDATAMVPGLTIDASGVGNAKGQLEASKVTFNPDEFAIEVAQEQQIMANKSAAAGAQSTANQGVSAAGAAQTSANTAQSTADQAGSLAAAAGTVAVMNTAAVQLVNTRVSDLDDYKPVAEAGIYYPVNGSTLDDAAKADLDKLAAIALQTDGYIIEIAGYASSTGTKEQNQELSEARASAVAQYLKVQKNIPLRRIVAPAGYGATHAAAANTDAEGRALNRRVDVTVLLNKGIDSGM